jgi:DNA-binding IclR family transcriptional regulator
MPRPRTTAEPETPKVLDKALAVLEAFGEESPEWSEAALQQQLAIPSTTLNRIVRGLERAGYLLRGADGRYRLGLAAVRLGRRASASLDLAAVLEPHQRELARRTGELVILAVADLATAHAVYVSLADSPKRLRVTAELGTRVPLTAGATARTILAFQARAQIDAVLARPVARLAAGTLTDVVTIRRSLARIRRRGWGLSWEETYDGAWAVAAPVLDGNGRALAAFGVATPISRHSRTVQTGNRDAVLALATAASRALRIGEPAEAPARSLGRRLPRSPAATPAAGHTRTPAKRASPSPIEPSVSDHIPRTRSTSTNIAR